MLGARNVSVEVTQPCPHDSYSLVRESGNAAYRKNLTESVGEELSTLVGKEQTPPDTGCWVNILEEVPCGY